MFESARLKLTSWYLLIIMIVSFAFSGVIYRAATFELGRFARAQQNRFENRAYIFDDGSIEVHPSPPQFDESLLDEARARILKSLVFINLGIFGLAGILGYYLSGKTLEPIATMVDEQYRFVSDASHELKTPITAMKSTLEVALRDKKMSIAEARKVLEINLEEIAGLQKLAEELLELSSENSTINLEKNNLNLLVSESIKILEPIANRKMVKIITKIPNIVMRAEKDSFRRAVTTVIDNAIKYSDQGSKISIGAEVVGRRIILKIKDRGIGIDHNEIEHIFDRFYRGDKARNTAGNGLGLAIAKKIVEQHNGHISAVSKLNKGTVITISLPYSAQIQKETVQYS